MPVITVDLETYYDTSYSLTRMSEVDYVLDERFQTIMAAVKVDNSQSTIHIGHQNVAARFAEIDWANSAFLSHNARFDGSILAWRFGIKPALYLDTLSMARAITHWELGSSSLRSVADHFGLPPKGREVEDARGKRLENFTGPELAAYAQYCIHDNDLCWKIFNKLRPEIPNSELKLIDLFLRMFIEPQVQLDQYVLARYLHQVRSERDAALERVASMPVVAQMAELCRTKHVFEPLDLLKKVFSSNKKFAELLSYLGVEVPMKNSPTTGEEIPALARNDRGFRELVSDASQTIEVQTVLAARVEAKSTLEEKRTEKLLAQAQRTWPDGVTGWGTVPIKFSGARTHRPSGDSGINWLNFKRGALVRDAIVAPDGYRIVHRDSSQIEARMVAWLAGCTILTQAFAEGRDVYCEFASRIYGRVVTKDDKLSRFTGKTAILSLGYSAGWERFRHMLFIGAGGVSHNADEYEARHIVDTYRRTYPEIPQLWQDAGRMMRRLAAGNELVPDRLAGIVAPQSDPPGLRLPNGMVIRYPGLRVWRDPATQSDEILYDSPYKEPVKIFGAKAVENMVQGLARIVVTDVALHMYELLKLRPFLTTYDSLDYVVREDQVEMVNDILEGGFAARPSWARDLPLASDGGWGQSLLQAERGDNV